MKNNLFQEKQLWLLHLSYEVVYLVWSKNLKCLKSEQSLILCFFVFKGHQPVLSFIVNAIKPKKSSRVAHSVLRFAFWPSQVEAKPTSEPKQLDKRIPWYQWLGTESSQGKLFLVSIWSQWILTDCAIKAALCWNISPPAALSTTLAEPACLLLCSDQMTNH